MISTSRTSETGTIAIDGAKCTGCALCVHICSATCLAMEDNKVVATAHSAFGCIGCGQCVAVCREEAIMVTGRTLQVSDYIPVQRKTVDADALYHLMLNRRSIRHFKKQPVPDALIDQIMQAASTAPMGIPPSDVGVLVIKGEEKVREFSFAFIDLLKGMQMMLKPLPRLLMTMTMSRDDRRAMREFIKPLVDTLVEGKREGKNHLLYDAPLALMFYTKQMADPADPVVACTYAMMAAESLGLGSCMIGSVGPFLKRMGKDFKAHYGLPPRMNDSIMLIIGYPKYKFSKTVKRTFAAVNVI